MKKGIISYFLGYSYVGKEENPSKKGPPVGEPPTVPGEEPPPIKEPPITPSLDQQQTIDNVSA